MSAITLRERVFYDLICSERRVYRHWYTRFLLAGVDLDRVRRVVGRTSRWRDWCAEWYAEGDQLERQAAQALAAGGTTRARRLFHEAAGCFHVGQHFFHLDQDLKQRSLERIWSVYPQAIALQPEERRPVRAEIPFLDTHLPAYLRSRPETQRPIVILINGLDNLKEIEQDAISQMFHDAGMNTLAFDGPGQGETLARLPMIPDYHTAVSAVIDWLEQEHSGHIDLTGIAAVGFSMGGFLAPQAAAHDRRITCVAGNGAPANLRFLLPERRAHPILLRALAHVAGTDTLTEAVERLGFDITEEPPLERPLLVVHSGRDRLIPDGRGHLDTFLDWAVGETESRFYPDGEHVCANYLDEVLPYTVDWVAQRMLGGSR